MNAVYIAFLLQMTVALRNHNLVLSMPDFEAPKEAVIRDLHSSGFKLKRPVKLTLQRIRILSAQNIACIAETGACPEHW